MGFFNLFKKKNEQKEDILSTIRLSKIKPGYVLDYDLKTWIVTEYGYYDWGEGSFAEEWQLKSGDDTVYLEREKDDEVFYCITRKIELEDIKSGLRQFIIKNQDPPEFLTCNGIEYHMVEDGTGIYFKGGRKEMSGEYEGEEMIYWEYEDQDGENILTIEQWGEKEFEAAAGSYVEEYEFTNILPGNVKDVQ